MQEVRRSFPFFPAVGAVVVDDFEWAGVRFPVGRTVLLDVYPTNRHPDTWERPGAFCPQRFAGRDAGPYELVAQGAGDHASGHRCPGERAVIHSMAVAVEMLTRRMDYALPPQDLRISRRRVPARPRSGVVVRNVRRRSATAG